eukprot:2751165-Pyramimonas_sp.AAC.1
MNVVKACEAEVWGRVDSKIVDESWVYTGPPPPHPPPPALRPPRAVSAQAIWVCPNVLRRGSLGRATDGDEASFLAVWELRESVRHCCLRCGKRAPKRVLEKKKKRYGD